MKSISKNKKSYIANAITKVILDKILINDKILVKIYINKSHTKYETIGSSGMDLSANIDNYEQAGKAHNSNRVINFNSKNYEVQIRTRFAVAKQQITVLDTWNNRLRLQREIKIILINHGDKKFKVEKDLGLHKWSYVQ